VNADIILDAFPRGEVDAILIGGMNLKSCVGLTVSNT
jgi:coenzyme F420-reducing hydrogenase delta subunit